mmetsp:Transcript_29207/g.82414  ORF Transcript_29207/g.82414 Transcript_29207/m.82414 type:complete len:390 (-) Transcript_29207:354-1523(-)|eukprot:CAMPEP_0117681294 /NCGR_PEP_ID=MMETSP0804-20121206/18879_1 /TAXON_ID=1074897 /ORGANISM="Tetraselmis astigmatica, Strain CCMP880" /LENGTH=389 /DNA_ID=CAMNT_0005490989 /DNA_START=158 /DNA_END=1327 /DNA_ORIENTATION=+
MATIMQSSRMHAVAHQTSYRPERAVAAKASALPVLPARGRRGGPLLGAVPLAAHFSSRDNQPHRAIRMVTVRAQKKTDSDDTKETNAKRKGGTDEKSLAKKEEVLQMLQTQGVSKSSAKEILKLWEGMGINSAEEMRRLLKKRGRNAVLGLTLQLLLDGAATWVAFSAGVSFGLAGGWNLIPSFVSYFLASYFGLNTVMETAILVGILSSGALFGTDAEALVRAVKELAGEDDMQVGLLSKTKQTVNMLKVVQTLNAVSDKLKESSSSMSSLEKLSAYLTLSQAKKAYGFNPDKYGITETTALQIATTFNRFDLNEDGALEASEFEKMMSDLEFSVSKEETEAIVETLDTKKTGQVEFDEFVNWYLNKLSVPSDTKVKEPAEAVARKAS